MATVATTSTTVLTSNIDTLVEDGVSKPPADVVLPPKDIRSIIERTAEYVARNGTVFEDRIREKEQANPKFSFLITNDAYHGFYAWRLSEIRAGRTSSAETGKGSSNEVQAAEPEKPKGPDPPPEFRFSARMPNINAQDLDVIRLTALFVAKHGRSFMTSLAQKESTNYQFDFLHARHSLYQYFSRLVDQYSELINARGNDAEKAEEARVAELTENIKNKFHMLDRAKQRAEWVQYQAKEKQKKEEEDEIERIQYAQIDWHDFVVVETVLFTEGDDDADLPPPTSLSDLQSASLEQKGMMSLAPHNMRIEEAMPTDFDPAEQYPNQQPPPIYPTHTPPVMGLPHLPPPPVPQVATPGFQNGATPGIPPPPRQTATPSAEEAYIRERTEARQQAGQAQDNARASATAPMKIRSDYVPRAQRSRQAQNTAICPQCKQPIPYDELQEHMRIELLDPRWKEQRAKSDSRNATTNLSTADVANNLKRLASQRSDVFDGATGEPISEEEAARRKKAATSYDGFLGGEDNNQKQTANAALQAAQKAKVLQQMPSMSIEEQLRHIREKASREGGGGMP